MITIIVPCYNEVHSICSVLAELSTIFNNAQIIVVDNNSNDGSTDIIKSWTQKRSNFEYHFCEIMGKANAIRSVLPFIRHQTVLLQDADLEYGIHEVKKLVELHYISNADMTIGIRSGMLVRSIIANKLIRFLLKIRFGKTVSDVLTGARVIKLEILLQCKSKEFGIETELTKISLKNDYKIVEGQCYYQPRIAGKKIKTRHMKELIWEALC